MKCRIIGSIVVAVMLWTTSPQAQTKPNFAGKWTLVPDKTQSGGSGGCPAFAQGLGGLAQEFTVAQTSTVLTIEGIRVPTLTTFAYKLDGSESKNEVPAGRGNLKSVLERAEADHQHDDCVRHWRRRCVKVTMKSTQVLSLDQTGLLNVVTTVGCRDNAPGMTTMVYRKGIGSR